MKKNTLKTILIILIIVLLSLVSFGGIYVKNLNSMKNLVKDYNLGMDLSKKMLIGITVEKEETTEENNQEADETKENSEEKSDQNEDSTAEDKMIPKKDIETAKSKIKARLNALEVEEFYIRTDYSDGSMIIELPNNTDTGFLSNIISQGDFQIVDSDGNNLGNSDVIKEVKNVIDRTSYAVPCVKTEIVFKKDFVKKLVDNKNNYAATTDEEGNTVEKKIKLQIDGQDQYSEEAIKLIDSIKLSNSLTLFMGKENSTETDLQNWYKSSSILATIIEQGKIPLKYKIDSANITTSNLTMNAIVIVGLVLLGVSAIWAVYKNKSQGVLAILSLIGYIAIMLLLIRYTNIIISFEGIFALGLIFAIEYIFNLKLITNFRENKEKANKIYSKTLTQFINVLVISFIIAIVFSMQVWAPIKSFGTIVFWGIIIMIAYNYLITKNLIETGRNRNEKNK